MHFRYVLTSKPVKLSRLVFVLCGNLLGLLEQDIITGQFLLPNR